ncbi:MAG: hypothetical protein UY44_C0001G0044 [Candidatus Kaiserbacteria bacterium GW2011_GWA2_49_19]|uniref:Uncharacterized protein n=1 Tax=Candidatus Kaiserbacteria bacterium GW2011_GWA2_49_19 TaxID=1618669 RepID=A0A0G1YSW9_9BACT|nr:MAG: hypothetical protein UY44_C0001G0044 [Candidatus Kaiserbacteria bacterium GW2011_GWA2_49_19]
MKDKKNKVRISSQVSIFTPETLKKIVEDVVLPSHHNLQLDIDTKIENLARMMARSFKETDEKVLTMDQRIILVREEILRKLDGTNVRIDDLALNRVKYVDFEILKKDVEFLKAKFDRKRVHGK